MMAKTEHNQVADEGRSAYGETRSKLWRSTDDARFLYCASALQRAALVRRGIPARYTEVLARAMHMSKERFYTTVGLSRATVDRKVKANKPLSPDESERVMGIARLMGQVQTLVEESGDPKDFDAARWLAEWLDHPLPALGGQRPAQLMDTADGRMLLADLLAQQQSAAYA
jgi:putative toxin-antitoxin system antitoxin component (TIGR02293 family)